MAKITVWLFIESGDLTVEEISARIGLLPDMSWKIGDPRGKTGKAYETNSWKLQSHFDEVDENPIEVGKKTRICLDDVLRRVRDYADRFRAVAFGRTAGLYLGISAREAPAIEIKAKTIGAVGSLGVDLEIDVMLQGPPERASHLTSSSPRP
jgi:hypothetical protein